MNAFEHTCKNSLRTIDSQIVQKLRTMRLGQSLLVLIKKNPCIQLSIQKKLQVRFSEMLETRLLFSLKPKEMVKMRLLAIWIDQR